MAYLIMKCQELGDQWECDAHRTPLCIVEDYHNFNPHCAWEAYIINSDNTIGECVREYRKNVMQTMAFVYNPPRDSNESAKVIKEYPNYTRYDEMPKKVKRYIRNAEKVENELKEKGYVVWLQHGKRYIYGEYAAILSGKI